jgi:hypothetical protein
MHHQTNTIVWPLCVLSSGKFTLPTAQSLTGLTVRTILGVSASKLTDLLEEHVFSRADRVSVYVLARNRSSTPMDLTANRFWQTVMHHHHHSRKMTTLRHCKVTAPYDCGCACTTCPQSNRLACRCTCILQPCRKHRLEIMLIQCHAAVRAAAIAPHTSVASATSGCFGTKSQFTEHTPILILTDAYEY